jgi:tripeptide aminopeptidase
MATRTVKRKSSARPATKAKSVEQFVTTDPRRLLNLVMELMAIPGVSGQERGVAEYITKKLRAAGAPASAITSDRAHKLTALAGDTGNLILKLPGTIRTPRRMLMAHMDTVPVCVGAKPVRKGDFLQSANPESGLGADDRAGVAVTLGAALAILEQKLPHPPLTFFWLIQEEIGLHGARHAQLNLLGKPKLAFNWDGGTAEKVTMGATGGYRLSIVIEGRGAHAGVAPEQGISAIAIASLAIGDLVRGGWHGAINKNGRRGTSNFGVIQGGTATNVVTDRVEILAEARSHDSEFRKQIVAAIQAAFEKAVTQVRNASGQVGKVTFNGRLDYDSFRLADDEPCLLAAEQALRLEGREPLRAVSNGGLDANWTSARGIPTVTLGCGQLEVHTTREKLDIEAFQTACRIALRLATATESLTR